MSETIRRGEPHVILLVDDDPITRNVVADILREEGYGVVEAADGIEALTLLDTRKFDLVISDVLMPNLNGLALLARIRLRWTTMPVILISASLSQGEAKAILDGSAHFIEKPIALSVLFAILQVLLPKPEITEAAQGQIPPARELHRGQLLRIDDD
jgi:CheY-like chemotaxis protein